MVEVAVRKALEAKRPAVEREPERPRQPRRRVRKLHNAPGFPDAYVQGEATRLLPDRDKGSPVERPLILRGYESSGDPIGEDDAGEDT